MFCYLLSRGGNRGKCLNEWELRGMEFSVIDTSLYSTGSDIYAPAGVYMGSPPFPLLPLLLYHFIPFHSIPFHFIHPSAPCSLLYMRFDCVVSLAF